MDNKTINMNDDEVETSPAVPRIKEENSLDRWRRRDHGGRLRPVQQVCYYPAVYLDFNGIYSFKRNYTDIFS